MTVRRQSGLCLTGFHPLKALILNSFDVPYSNGFTEGCNNKIKVLKRNAYGYRNFGRFRNRILHMFSYKNDLAKQGRWYTLICVIFPFTFFTTTIDIEPNFDTNYSPSGSPNSLIDEPFGSSIKLLAPPAGLEPATSWLTVMRSANWAIEEYFVFFSLNTKDNDFSVVIFSIYSFRQLSTFPGSHPPSIIDVKELNFCVRYGNRWILLAIVTESVCVTNTNICSVTSCVVFLPCKT